VDYPAGVKVLLAETFQPWRATVPAPQREPGDEAGTMLDWVGERTRICDDEARRALFVDLHRDHASGVFNLALQLVGHHEDARDITQEVLLKAYQQLGRPGPFNARAWLYRVTVNASFDHLRARRRKPVVDLEGSAEPVAAVNEYEQAELQRQLGCALRRLPPTQRTALMLREVHGLPVDEVAFVLGVQTDSAAVTLSRARTTFRRRFLEVANGSATETAARRQADETAAAATRRRRVRRGGASAGLAVGVGVGLPSLALPALPLPASLEASSLLPGLAPAAPVAALAAPAAAAGSSAAAGVIGKIAAALSTKAAAVAVGASLVAGGAGGVYTAERATTSARHGVVSAQTSGAHTVDKAHVGAKTASPHPSPRATASAIAVASPSPVTSPGLPATDAAEPQPTLSATILGETGDMGTGSGGPGTSGSPSPTPSPVVTPSPSPSAPSADPTPSPSVTPTVSVSPSPAPSSLGSL
jgi:RNA polymerase sigma-70 factor (ECF subfamily)